jgi:hypothetical protein
MEKTLYIFAIMPVKEEVPISPEMNKLARQQWAWINEQVKSLPAPNRVYLDSLH